MAQRQSLAAAGRLKRTRERIEHWRRTREKLSPIPENLWEEAAVLARELGVNPVKSALGLNYESLKARVGGSSAGGATTGGGFVELSGAQLLAEPATGASVVEVFESDGARLTVRMASDKTLDLGRLVEAFRRRSA